MSDDKIYLRVVQDGLGVKVVDQDDREVANLITVSTETVVGEWNSASIRFSQAKSENERLYSGSFEGQRECDKS